MVIADAHNSIFQIAADFVNQTSCHVFLTGKAGTGKTTFLKHICQTTHKNCVVAAPTGVAAINAGGVTLHSLFQLSFDPFIPGPERQKKEWFRISSSKLSMLRRLDLLIIDEVSMLRADVLDAIDATLKWVRRNRKPFGGIQMLYIGDLFQLPPVIKENEWSILREYYQSPFFFHAKSLQQVQPIYLELKKVYRQREQLFIDLLNRVRNNEMTKEDLSLLNNRHKTDFTPLENENYITLTTHNAKADLINSRELEKLPGKIYNFQGVVDGDFPDYTLPTDLSLQLKKGTQVMFIKNDLNEPRRYFNGKIGIVSEMTDHSIHINLPESNETVALIKETWRNIRYRLNGDTGEIEEEELGTFVQYPIRLAWAITIHKSQGLTFENAIIDAGDAFAPGQAYVALSRCTSLEGVILMSPITHRSIQTDEQAINLSKSEKEESELHSMLQDGKRLFWVERLLQYFDFENLLEVPRQFGKLLDKKDSNEYDNARILLKKMYAQAFAMKDVAEKFKIQLNTLIKQQQISGDVNPIAQRCQQAVQYFYQSIINQMLVPLQDYINGMKLKRAKTYQKQVCGLEQEIKLFLENLKKVRYNDIPFMDGFKLPAIPERHSLYDVSFDEKRESFKKQSNTKKTTNKNITQKSLKVPTNGHPDKRSTQELQSADETAKMAHWAKQIRLGKVSVYDVLPKQTINELLPWMQAAVQEDNFRLASIMKKTGGKYSFFDIRLVMNHCLYESEQKT